MKKALGKTFLLALILIMVVASITACADNRNVSDDFDPDLYIVSCSGTSGGGELTIEVTLRDDWEFTSSLKRNKIRVEVGNRIEQEEKKHKKDDSIVREAIIVKTENGDDADMNPEDTGVLLYSGDSHRGVDEVTVRIDGQLYYGTTERGVQDETKKEIRKIESFTDNEEIPTKDGQASLDIVGTSYTNGGSFALVEITDDEWYYFYPEKRMYKVFSDDEMLDDLIDEAGVDIDNEIGIITLKEYDSGKYKQTKSDEKFFLEAVEIMDFYKSKDMLQVFVDVRGEGYAMVGEELENTHGFAQRWYYTFKKDESDFYVFEDAKVYGEIDGGEKSSHDFCISPIDDKFLEDTYKRLFEADKSEKVEEVINKMYTNYARYIGYI